MNSLRLNIYFLAASSAAEKVKKGACPASGGSMGICVHDDTKNCTDDSACAGKKKCCSDGCGKVCTDPETKKKD